MDTVNTSSLSVGQEFKNLQQLSLTVLGEKLPPGKGRTNRVKKMQHYFSWRTVPNSQKIIITEIYTSKRKPISGKSIYAPLLYKELESYHGELVFTKSEMIRKFKIFNENFDAKNFVNTSNTLKIKYKMLKLVQSDIYGQLSKIIEKALQQLEEHGYISIERTKKIYYSSPGTKEVQPEEIDKIYKEQQKFLQCNSYYDVIQNNLAAEYNILCKSAFEKINVRQVRNVYKISILRPMEAKSPGTTLSDACQKYLLQHFSLNPLHQKVISFYTKK